MELTSTTERVREAAAALGLVIAPIRMDRSTRTAEEAAAACGCAVGQIVKSLVFEGKESGKPYLFLVSGANRVDQERVAGVLGEPLKRPDGAAVRRLTGFAIGGIPPFGHISRLDTWIDADLFMFSEVWAAAGTPETVFSVAPNDLSAATRAQSIQLGT